MNFVLLAQEHGGEHEGEFSPVVPVVEELIWAAIFFLILLFVVVKVAKPKLDAALAARQAAITGQLTAAEETRTQADSLLAEYRAKLADAQAEAGRIIDEGRRTAEGIVAEARSRAEAEAQGIVTRAQADIQTERDRAIAALRSELASISIDVASRVVGRSLDNEAQRSLVDSYIDELAATSRQN